MKQVLVKNTARQHLELLNSKVHTYAAGTVCFKKAVSLLGPQQACEMLEFFSCHSSVKLALLILDYAQSTLLLLFSLVFPLIFSWENAMLVTQRKNLSTWEKFLKQSGQRHVDKLIFGKMRTEGSNNVRSFCLATISVICLETAQH